VAETAEQTREQVADVAIGLEHEDAAHGGIVACARSDVGWIWYGEDMSTSRVLVVDDEADVRRLVRELLERAGHVVDEAPDGRTALRVLYGAKPDLVVLDVTMPELDGWQTLERIRDVSDVPVLMLTARAAELEKVRGLRAGADDYVTKPFGRQELLARVEAALRRSRRASEPPERYADAVVEIDFAQAQVRVNGREVALTPLEFRLLGTFVRHPNQVLSRDQLLELVWGNNAAPEQVKLYVGYLRRKLGVDGLIETVRGFGYRYRKPS
jgi:DNA-binding response OmpR family regulator